MIYLITGASGSGKSEYAENLIMGMPCSRRYYVATMEVYGEEGREKVRRHQGLRQGKGFVTLECREDVDRAIPVPDPEAVALLECVSNLAANEMFGRNRESSLSVPDLAKKIAGDMKRLSSCVRDLVIVTNEVASDGVLYDGQTMEYIRLMGLLGGRLADMADYMVEVVYSIPVIWKASAAIK